MDEEDDACHKAVGEMFCSVLAVVHRVIEAEFDEYVGNVWGVGSRAFVIC